MEHSYSNDRSYGSPLFLQLHRLTASRAPRVSLRALALPHVPTTERSWKIQGRGALVSAQYYYSLYGGTNPSATLSGTWQHKVAAPWWQKRCSSEKLAHGQRQWRRPFSMPRIRSSRTVRACTTPHRSSCSSRFQALHQSHLSWLRFLASRTCIGSIGSSLVQTPCAAGHRWSV